KIKEPPMAREGTQQRVDRRKFLAGAAGVAVAGAASGAARPSDVAHAAPSEPEAVDAVLPRPPRSAVTAAAETRAAPGGTPATPHAKGVAGSDFMVDVIKTLDITYLPANPASSFRGIHESLINYGRNTKPEFLTCTHEESAAAMCHGYFKAAGKPL